MAHSRYSATRQASTTQLSGMGLYKVLPPAMTTLRWVKVQAAF
jgi:hypothetical protein